MTRATAPAKLALLLLCLALPVMAAAKAKPRPKAEAAKPAAAAPAPVQPPAPPRIPLQRNLRFVVRPTLLGLLPPPDPLNFGEAFIRVLGQDSSHIWLRYEIKEQLERDPATGQLFELDSAPLGLRTETLTRIRRGDVSTTRSAGDWLLPPLFWNEGNWASPAGLLWLDSATFAALRSGGEPLWRIELPERGLPLDDELPGLLEQRRLASALPAGETARLRLIESGASYRCLVNGAAVNLPALRAVDSMLLAEYWFLDDADNPMLLKLSYLPLQEADPAARGWAAVINAGGGCAVTQLDY